MSHMEKQVWHLWRDGIPYTLIVWPPTLTTTWLVDIHSGHVDQNNTETWLNTLYLDRGTHLVADSWDAVSAALKERDESG